MSFDEASNATGDGDNTAGQSSSNNGETVLAMAQATPAVTGSDDEPRANDDAATVDQGTGVVINVIANDTQGSDGVDLGSGVALASTPNKGTAVYNGDGTFTYTPAVGAEGRDSFTYSLTDGTGDVSIATVNVMLTLDAEQLAENQDGVIVLPPGVELDDVRVDGRNLIVTLPDGTEMVIPNGAVFVPEFVVNGTLLPGETVTAFLLGLEPQPAAGDLEPTDPLALPGSGANFAREVGDIGDPVDLGDLLPFTDYAFNRPDDVDVDEAVLPEEEEIVNTPPGVIVETPENPGGAINATDSVDESGLPSRGDEPEGTNEPGDVESTSGQIDIDPGNSGVASVTINGVAVTAVGQTFVTPFGTLTITSISETAIGYSYTLADNTSGDVDDVFVIVVTENDGDTAEGSLTISIIDDAPIARDDGITQAVENDPVVVNVFANDTQGADGVDLATGVEVVAGTLTGTGSLVYSGNGTFTYTPGPGEEGTVSFTYQITDGDGSTDTAVATITLQPDSTPSLNLGADGQVDEAALFDGTNPSSTAESTSGTFSIDTGGDTVGSFFINGVDVTNGGSVPGTYGTLVVTLSNGVYSYVYTLSDNTTDHPNPNSTGTAEGIFDVFNAVLTDSDNDQTTDTLNIAVLDDGPIAVADGRSTGTVDEDGLAGGNPGGVGDVAGAATVATGSVSGLFIAGADSPLTFSLNGDLSALNALNLSSGGVALTYAISGNTVTASAGSTTVFTFALTSGGNWTFTLLDQLDHLGDNTEDDINIDFGSLVDATDADGDSVTASGSVLVVVDDDTPTTNAANSTGTVDEDGLANGIAGGPGDVAGTATTASGSVAALFNSGADTPLTYSLNGDLSDLNALALESGGEAVAYDLNGNVLTAYVENGANAGYQAGEDTDVFTFTLNAATGAWQFALLSQLDHPSLDGLAGDDTENDIVVDFGSMVDATDADGDSVTASGSVLVTVDDDTPTATDEGNQNVAEGGVINGMFDFAGGADGASVTEINGITLTFGGDGFSQNIDTGSGTIKVKADGTYQFTADASVDNTNPVVDNVVFTVTDGDSDEVTGTASFTITDANTPTGGTTAALVDDDGLTGPPAGNPASTTGDAPDANADGDNDETTFSGTLDFSFGGDGAGSVSFASMHNTSGMVGQETVDYTWNGATNTLTATGPRGVLFTVEITNTTTGAFTVTLMDNVLQAQGPNNENDATAALTYTVTDLDNSSTTGTLNVTFDDDAPTASDEGNQQVAEGGVINGQFDFVEGADGASVTEINGVTLTFGMDGFSQSIDIGDGTIKVKADGTYQFTADSPIAGTGSASATFKVVDGDGDEATGDATFTVTDANTPTGGTTAALVDDDGLTGPPAGNPASTIGDAPDANLDGDNDETTFSGTLDFSFGGDGAGSVTFASMDMTSGMVGQETVDYTWDGGTNTLTATGPRGVLFTVTVNPTTGAFTVTLMDNVLQAQGPNDENDATAALTYTITDADNSSTTGTLNVTFDDDAPTASDEGNQNVAEGGVINGQFDFVEGADGASVTEINGVTLTFGMDGFSQAIDTGEGAIKVKADGTYQFTAGDPVDNTNPVVDNVTFKVVDGDGDEATGTASFTITDANSPTAGASQSFVDDEGLSGGITGGTGDLNANAGGDTNPNEAIYTNTLTGVAFGGDGAGSIDFMAMDGDTDMIGTETVTYSWDGNTGTLTATITGGPRDTMTLFTVTIDDVATATYTVTLENNVLHAAGNDENNANVTLDFTVTDSDGSTAPGTLAIVFDDDSPIAFSPDDGVGDNTGSDVITGHLDTDDNINNNVGADGLQSLVWDNITNGDQLFESDGITAVTSGGNDIFLFIEMDGSLTATTDDTNSDANAVVFTAVLDSTTSTYEITFEQALDDGSLRAVGDFSSAAAGNTPWKGVDSDLVNGNTIDIEDGTDPNPDSTDLLFTPLGGPATINSDNDDIGTGTGQKVNPGEALRVDLVTDLRRDPGQDETDVGGYLYDDHSGQAAFAFTLVDIQGNAAQTSVVQVQLFNVDDTNPATLNNVNLSNSLVNIDLASIVVEDINGNVLTLGVDYEVYDDGAGGAYVDGLHQGDQVFVKAQGGVTFEAVVIQNADGEPIPGGGGTTFDGNSFGLGGFEFGEDVAGSPVDFELDVLLTDNDGDSSSGTIDVTINPAVSSLTASLTQQMTSQSFSSTLIAAASVGAAGMSTQAAAETQTETSFSTFSLDGNFSPTIETVSTSSMFESESTFESSSYLKSDGSDEGSEPKSEAPSSAKGDGSGGELTGAGESGGPAAPQSNSMAPDGGDQGPDLGSLVEISAMPMIPQTGGEALIATGSQDANAQLASVLKESLDTESGDGADIPAMLESLPANDTAGEATVDAATMMAPNDFAALIMDQPALADAIQAIDMSAMMPDPSVALSNG